MSNFIRAIRGEAQAPCCYGLAPPKLSTPAERVEQIAEGQVERLRELSADAVIVYDIQDEPSRSGEKRPFPFLPTRDPADYALRKLEASGAPAIVYRSVSGDTAEGLSEWLKSLEQAPAAAATVLVGAASSTVPVRTKLGDAYRIAREVTPEFPVGAIAIAERHRSHNTEHQRMQRKLQAGCRFFVTQAVYDLEASQSLLRDYASMLESTGTPSAPVIVTFAPCASATTVRFMKWLGIAFPESVERELLSASDPLQRSLGICERTFEGLLAEAKSLGLTLGINVESVSIRRNEIEASVELFRRLRALLAQ